MDNPEFWRISIGNAVTWGLIVVGFIYNYGRSATRYEDNSRKITENSKAIEALKANFEAVQTNGSAGARHLFELLNTQIASHEVRITLHDSTVKDVIEIRTKVDLMFSMMKRHWELPATEERT